MQPVAAKIFFGSKSAPESGDWVSQKPKWNQVHGVRCVELRSVRQECGDADAFWTKEKGIPVGVCSADCVPILIECSQDGRAVLVGAIHAGWRGTLAHIVEHFRNSIPEGLVQGGEWRAWIGPSIRACCYEVSPELIDQFSNEFSSIPLGLLQPKNRHLDLVEINRFELKKQGIDQIWVHPDCTFCGEKHFSYRRGDRNARQYSIISF